MQILLSRTQAGPDRIVKEEQEEISPNYVQRLNLISVSSANMPYGKGEISTIDNEWGKSAASVSLSFDRAPPWGTMEWKYRIYFAIV